MIPVFHPVAPTLRRELPGGFGLMTPVKSTPKASAFNESGGRRDAYIARISRSAVKPFESSVKKSMTLGDILAGKILGSPSPEVSRRAPSLVSNHGGAWQLLRQVEQQRKQIEMILKEIEQLKK